MSGYYKPRRVRGLYDPDSREPFRLSRSKLDLFLNCPRCFYLDRRLGVGQPPGFPFALNSAVDKLLKKEFDAYRAKGVPHPVMTEHGIDAVPFKHARIEEWRDALRGGVTFLHPTTNFFVTGAIDDVWIKPTEELIVVDYKSTAKQAEITLDADWQIGYKRQMELYQWLFRNNGFAVSPTGYFVYCNGKTDRRSFDRRLEFDIDVIPYTGDDAWVEPALADACACLRGTELPEPGPGCDFCRYRGAVRLFER